MNGFSGDAIADCIADGIVTREELFVSSKLNNPYHRKEHVKPMLEKSLLDLRLDYVDMYLMHWPTAFKYVPYEQEVCWMYVLAFNPVMPAGGTFL